MDTKRFTLDTTLTLIAAYLGFFVGLIDANAINLVLPAIRDVPLPSRISRPRRREVRRAGRTLAMLGLAGAEGARIATMLGGLVQLIGAAVALRWARPEAPTPMEKEVCHA
jgi:hypothetical protein